ncbi:MAG: acyl-CoA dehydrogenase family protein [Nannocystaceae bacterium]|nr:acyl-CoA dehydrogenase family protein [bacterium]
MDIQLSERQLEVQALAREYAESVLAPAARQWDAHGGFPLENLSEAAKRGLTGIGVSKALGGLEAGTVAYSLAVTEMAKACASSTVALCVNNMVAEVVEAFGTPQQRELHVPKLCNFEHVVGAFALSEPGAGSDPGGMRTRAVKTDKGWLINGSKLWITSGTHAGLFVVWAKTSDAPGARGISTFLVPADTPGVQPGKPEHKMGLHGSTTTALDFTDVEVGDDALLGETDRGFRAAMMALDGGRIGIASQALGVGQAALEHALAYVRERADLARAQAVQWRLADIATDLDAGRLLALQAAWRKENKMEFSRQASMAKMFCSEKAVLACNRALEVLGEFGNDVDGRIEQLVRDVRVTMIYEGTSEVQRIVISRDIARRFGDGA